MTVQSTRQSQPRKPRDGQHSLTTRVHHRLQQRKLYPLLVDPVRTEKPGPMMRSLLQSADSSVGGVV